PRDLSVVRESRRDHGAPRPADTDGIAAVLLPPAAGIRNRRAPLRRLGRLDQLRGVVDALPWPVRGPRAGSEAGGSTWPTRVGGSVTWRARQTSTPRSGRHISWIAATTCTSCPYTPSARKWRA